jgi:hypothetical protein
MHGCDATLVVTERVRAEGAGGLTMALKLPGSHQSSGVQIVSDGFPTTEINRNK